MDTFDPAALWDLSQPGSLVLDTLHDSDIIALLQKTYPPVNPLHSFADIPALTPPSVDSSPSPPTITDHSNPQLTPSRRTTSSSTATDISGDDSVLKRKASDDSLSDETPSHKNPHTESRDSDGIHPATGAGNKRIAAPSRRKNETAPDHSKLLKRKEQNRAAQRAFRERKEKHVKDLEDKVAALEARNDRAVSENENLRDLLARLQSENMRLRQNSFTFQVPKGPYGSDPEPQLLRPSSGLPTPSPSLSDIFNTSSTPSVASSSPIPPPQNSVFANDNFDWNSLMTFDPAVLTLLDDSTAQPPADADATVPMDLGFGATSLRSPRMPYTTIASNPSFMSFADAFDSSAPVNVSITAPVEDTTSFTYDLPSWPASGMTPQPLTKEPNPLDEFFGNGNFLNGGQSLDFNLLAGPSISPVLHTHVAPSSFQSDPSMFNLSRGTTASPLLGSAVPSTSNAPAHAAGEGAHDKCPKTKAQVESHITAAGSSPFAPPPVPVVQLHKMKELDDKTRSIITCQGTKGLPKTAKSDANVEVLEAWKKITSTAAFKEAAMDMNELCEEFSKKARCDGTKVVLEPQGVASIIDSLSKRSQKQR